MQLTHLFAGAVALSLSAPVLALPEPISPNSNTLEIQKRATNCGINVHDGSMCPEGAECNCAIQNPCVGWLCTPNVFYYCVEAGCVGCDCPNM
ncbi:hypothetical protein ACO1O0_000074 [Amphichorda felina]